MVAWHLARLPMYTQVAFTEIRTGIFNGPVNSITCQWTVSAVTKCARQHARPQMSKHGLSLSPTPSPSLSCSFPSVSYTFPISLLGPRAWHQGRVDGRVTRPPLRLYTCFACCISRWLSGIDEAVGEGLRTLSLTPIRIAQSLSASISPSSAWFVSWHLTLS